MSKEGQQTTHRETAVALKYDGKRAPTVAASGMDEIAEEIIRLAREHGVPLYESPELASILARLDLDEEIPDTLYRVIAEILAFAFNLQGKTPADAGRDQDSPP
ncbi:MAG: EscU/YscU/HrcU family type III secretion system export apparatus switch protein [Marinobacter sp.]|nr:EscU/YscU/HrcU family type III secretion system export apparatus switch protein [Marinobacter sp.]